MTQISLLHYLANLHNSAPIYLYSTCTLIYMCIYYLWVGEHVNIGVCVNTQLLMHVLMCVYYLLIHSFHSICICVAIALPHALYVRVFMCVFVCFLRAYVCVCYEQLIVVGQLKLICELQFNFYFSLAIYFVYPK